MTDGSFAVYRDVRAKMRDGIELSSDIYFPAENGVVDLEKKYPVMLIRIPYVNIPANYDGVHPWGIDELATKRGYVLVINVTRGRGSSEGEFIPFETDRWEEKQDGVDVVKWILAQKWCNGKVGTFGISYMGGTQMYLHLAEPIDGLETAAVSAPGVNMSRVGWLYDGDFLAMATLLGWSFSQVVDDMIEKRLDKEKKEMLLAESRANGDPLEGGDPMALPGLYLKYGLNDMPVMKHISWYREWIENRENMAFYDKYDIRTRKFASPEKKKLFIGGWYDLFLMNTLECYDKAMTEAPTAEAKAGQQLILGPWAHAYLPGRREFEGGACSHHAAFYTDWMDYVLRGEANYFEGRKITLYVMGENRWRSEKEWPLSDAVPTRLYLHSGGHAGEEDSDGILNLKAPEKEKRPDILCYTSDVLEEDVEVTGYVRACIAAATSAEDTDFFMTLTDVTPEGESYEVVTGGRRGRYLGGRENPAPLTPGKTYLYEFPMRATSMVFKKGHRIRIYITSSYYPEYELNPNRYIDLNTCTEKDFVTAEQTIYHDSQRVSYIELPVVPNEHEKNWTGWPYSEEELGIGSFKAEAGMYERVALPTEKNAAELDQ